ncbi:MAG: hypothetical protein M1840_008433 [Geoglossum simile]|nr:MAG: hypothetical protein M1840_008433 [Geoglossum simile]
MRATSPGAGCNAIHTAVEAQSTRNLQGQMELWGSEIGKAPPVVQYEDVMASDKGVAEWTLKIRTFGFCYVDGCPVSPEKTQGLLERISFIRPTHYGGFYDFTADLASKDTAYTSLALQAHTDTTYFSDPAGLQMFHLLSHTDGSGGESLLVDGFAAAKILQKEAPGCYNVLSRQKIRSHASGNEGISIQSFTGYPVLNHDSNNGSLFQTRWNSSDRATMDSWHDDKLLEEWYEAAWKWCEILQRPEVELWERLRPGRPLIFDNWRVLHGRAAFTGKRRICGGYINYDDFMSRYRMTNLGRDEVLLRL